MGGPFRAIVGGQASYRWAFPPAQAIRVNNHTTQYGHLIEIDEFVAPGQLGLVIPLENPLAGITFKFEAPPNATQAAATQGQVALVNTYDVSEVGVSVPPLGPDPGLLLPIGLDSPQHSHNHTHGNHNHGHAHTHAHTHGSHNHGLAHTHAHTHGSHTHVQQYQSIGVSGPGIQGISATLATLDHTHFYNDPSAGNLAGASTLGTTPLQDTTGSSAATVGDTTPLQDTTGSSTASTDLTTPAADTTLENVQHTHS